MNSEQVKIFILEVLVSGLVFIVVSIKTLIQNLSSCNSSSVGSHLNTFDLSNNDTLHCQMFADTPPFHPYELTFTNIHIFMHVLM